MVMLGNSEETITLKNKIVHKIVLDKFIILSPGFQSA